MIILCVLFRKYSFVPKRPLVLSVCLSVFQLPTVKNSKPIVMKLYQVVEAVSSEKPIDFEVKGHLEVKFLKSSFLIWLTWNLNTICVLRHWIGKPTIFEVKGQLKVKVPKSSIFIWKIINFHLINLKIKQQLQSASLNLETNYFWGQKFKRRLKVKLLNVDSRSNF